MASANPTCPFCDTPMRVLTGTGRNPFYCPNDCDRKPRRICPTCSSQLTRQIASPTWSFAYSAMRWQRAWSCIPHGHVFDLDPMLYDEEEIPD